jgi:hypothetical protein
MTDVKAAGRQDMTMTARDKARKPTDTCSRGVHTHRRTRKRQVAVGQPPAYFMIAMDARQVGSAPGEYRAAVGGRAVAADTCTPQSMRYVADLGVISPQEWGFCSACLSAFVFEYDGPRRATTR